MDKSIKYLQFSKKVLGILSSLFLIVGAVLHIVLSYSGGNYKVTLSVINCFAVCVVLFMSVNIADLVIKRKISLRGNNTYQEKTFKNSATTKIYNFTNKNSFLIGIILSSLNILLGFLAISRFFLKDIGQYWKVYFYLMPLFWGILIYSIFALICSKDKKSLIISIVFSSLTFLFNVVFTVLSCIMMFGRIGAFTNTTVYNVLLICYAILMFIPFGLISTNGDYNKCKFSTVFGIGFLTCLLGSIVLYSNKILSEIMIKYDLTGTIENKHVMQLSTLILIILLGILFAINVFNFWFNLKKFIKNKEIIGLCDLTLGVIGVVLYLIGLYRYVVVLLYL